MTGASPLVKESNLKWVTPPTCSAVQMIQLGGKPVHAMPYFTSGELPQPCKAECHSSVRKQMTMWGSPWASTDIRKLSGVVAACPGASLAQTTRTPWKSLAEHLVPATTIPTGNILLAPALHVEDMGGALTTKRACQDSFQDLICVFLSLRLVHLVKQTRS